MADGLQKCGDVLGQLWPRQSGALFAVRAVRRPHRLRRARVVRRAGRHVPVRGGVRADAPAGSTACSSASPSAWSARSSRGTRRSGSSATRSAPRCSPAAPWCSSRHPRRPARATCSPRSRKTSDCRPACSTCVTADREVSELLVRDPGVDKITFTGSTAAGRRIASLCGERIARCTLELGGKSAAVILDDMDLATAAKTIARAECTLSGQVCSSLTRIVVTQAAGTTSSSTRWPARSRKVRVGDPFDETSQMGPLVSERQRDRVEGYIAQGRRRRRARSSPAAVVPKDLDRGWYVEPTVFDNVDNSLDDRPRGDLRAGAHRHPRRRRAATRCGIANDTIYGLNASVFTHDVDRAREVAGQLRSGTVGHNAVPHRLRHVVRRLQAVGHRTRRREGRAAARSSRPSP